MAGYFSTFLVILTLSSGLIWLIDHFIFAPKRQEGVLDKIAPMPAITESAISIFPMIAAITIFRSFFFEPFQIPSGSMKPTLLVGDFILVQKFTYGIKDPVWRTQLVEMDEPERGDITVFKYPLDTNVDFIKRVVGLPGDIIVYRNKQLYIKPKCSAGEKQTAELICGEFNKIALTKVNDDEFSMQGMPLPRLTESLAGVEHDILINPRAREAKGRYFPQTGTQADEWRVPEDNYFLMGDNRDNSADGRFWGFVPKEHLVGKAVFIWMSFEFDNGPEDALPSWIPTGVRFDRLGSIQ